MPELNSVVKDWPLLDKAGPKSEFMQLSFHGQNTLAIFFDELFIMKQIDKIDMVPYCTEQV